MKILFDECVPRRFRNLFPQHEATTVPSAGFAGLKNGELLTAAANAGFEVFVTVDRNLAYQQNISKLALPVVVLHAKSNKISDIIPFSTILAALLIGNLENKVYDLKV